MQNKASEASANDGSSSNMAADPFDILMRNAEVGLAIFDAELNLIKCNNRYQSLCDYGKDEVAPGTPLSKLVRISLERHDHSTSSIEQMVSNVFNQIESNAKYTFQFASNSGQVVEVTRHRSSENYLVETLRPVDIDELDNSSTQAAQVAGAARDRLSHALEVMADGFALFDRDDRLVVYNRKYVELNPGISHLIMPGADYETMMRKHVEAGGFDLGDKSPEEYLQWRLEQHRNPGEAYEHKLSDGRWVLVHEKATNDGGIVGSRSDITALKLREQQVMNMTQALKSKNAHFDTALNNMIQGLCMFDSDKKLIVCNNRYLEMYGFSNEVVKPGIAIPDIMKYSISLGNYTQEEAERAQKERKDDASLGKRTTIKQHLADGRVIAVMNEPMDGGGTIATYQDITALERNEQKLMAYNGKLERSNRELQDFAYVASHDLQEPLRKIEAFGDRLSRKYGADLPDDGKMYIERMQNASTRMRQLITDLLSYARVTTKAKPFSDIKMGEVLEGVVSDLQMRLEDDNGKIIIGDMPDFTADETQMRQLFQNLISNALKFKKPDVDPIVKVDCTSSEETGIDGSLQLFHHFTIADNGIGFDNQYKDQIFTIFQRLHGRMEYEGTGIGLATCRKIVERHLGNIDANGEPDVGATFCISLPAHQSSEGSE